MSEPKASNLVSVILTRVQWGTVVLALLNQAELHDLLFGDKEASAEYWAVFQAVSDVVGIPVEEEGKGNE